MQKVIYESGMEVCMKKYMQEIDKEIEKQIDKEIDKQIEKQIDKQIEKQIDNQEEIQEEMQENIQEKMQREIQRKKKETDTVILAHYYTDGQVQDVADYVGDSYYLSEIATKVSQQNILFCGVTFMGESAKILNEKKKVLMPDLYADCPMAHMADIDRIDEVRQQYKDVAVVCYINSTTEIKAASDVCVTSSNAVKIVKALKEPHIYFIPDENLGRYVASQVPEKEFIFNDGFCHVHTSIEKEALLKAKELHKEALILAHPECKKEILDMADYIGSTSGILAFAAKSKEKEYIICTEMGILHELEKQNTGKKFYFVGHRQFCPNMKRITLEKVLEQLELQNNEIQVEEKSAKEARNALEKMLFLAKE